MDSIISGNLKMLRKLHCLTQKNVADLIKRDRSLIAKYEQGLAIPPLPILQQLAEMYRVDVNMLFARPLPEDRLVFSDSNGEEPDSETLRFAQLSEQERMLIMKLRLCEPETMDAIFLMLDEDEDADGTTE